MTYDELHATDGKPMDTLTPAAFIGALSIHYGNTTERMVVVGIGRIAYAVSMDYPGATYTRPQLIGKYARVGATWLAHAGDFPFGKQW